VIRAASTGPGEGCGDARKAGVEIAMPNGSPSYFLIVVTLAILGVVIAGLRGMREGRGRNIVDYFLGGRASGWRNLTASLFVTTLWGALGVGLILSAGVDLISWGFLAGSAIAGLVLLGFVFVGAYRDGDVMTTPALLGKWYGDGRVRVSVSLALMALTLFVRIPLTIIIGGKMLNMFFGWDPVTSALLMIVVPGFFAVAGGYAAMMAMHGAVSLIAVTGLLFAAATGLLGSDLLAAVPDNGGGTEWIMLVSGLLLNTFWTTCMDQSVAQRAAAARSWAETRRGAFTAAGAIGCVAFISMILITWRPLGTAPSGFWGDAAVSLLGSSLLALAMAIISTDLVSVSTLFTMDLFGRTREQADGSAFVLAGRLMATVSVFVSIIAASFLALLGEKVVPWLLDGYVVLAAPVVAVALIGFVWPRVRGRGAFWALVSGWIAGALHWTVEPDLMPLRTSVLLTTLALFALTGIVLVAVSLLRDEGFAGRRIFVGKRVEVRKP
jgi:solute:Na+ symporter, SSS family